MIAWPPDMATIMNVTGFKEALKNTIPVNLGGDLIVNVVSIPALAVLKIVTWNDRGLEDSRDAHDFLYLLRNYHEAGNADRLYDEAASIMESCGYALDLAGAALLGYDIGLIVEGSTRQAVLQVLEDPVKRDRLTVHMARGLQIDTSVAAGFIAQFEHGLHLPPL